MNANTLPLDKPLSDLPAARVVLKPRKARPFFGRHPWVLDSAIARVEGDPADGDVVELFSDRGQPVARGLINSRSRLRVRLYSWTEGEALDDNFWRRRVESALRLRSLLGLDDPEGGVRLVASEGDGLGGLTVDRYGPWLVVQVTALAMARRIERITAMLAELVEPRGIVVRGDPAMSRLEGLAPEEVERVVGQSPEDTVFISEHGLRYGVPLSGGQKMGFFLDQRDNRRAAARYVRGRRVLDVCCYSGAFALAASVLGGAREVLGIDSSQKAVALAAANARLNDVTNVRFEAADAFGRLKSLVDEGARFGAVILDPPKFAAGRSSVERALKAYQQLNRLAVDALEPEGILVTCSCSGHVSREDLLFVLADVAQRSRRPIQVLQQRGAAPDHPVSASCLETEYLKCFICRVG